MKNPPLYHYHAKVVSVYDGDTCTVDIDLGLNVWARGEKIRLARINTPELRKKERPKGLISRDYLRKRILNQSIVLETIKDKKGKYGRYLGEIWVQTNNKNYTNINDELVMAGMAEYKSY
ncbi:MAG: thermonuclease family protein [Fidelibacterota bacterium]